MAVRVASSGSKRKGVSGNYGMLFLAISILVSAIIVSKAFVVQPIKVKETVTVAEFDTISVPVPSAPVPLGTKVKNIRFTSVRFPKQQLPDGAIRDLTGILDATAISPLPANLPVFESNFSRNFSASNPVIERIPEGMRAMTIRVDATSAVEGWAGSGALVDVLLVTKERTSVIAEKVKILSAERSVSPVEGGSAPNVPSTVTLLVTQEQCLAINTAIPLGKIAFALRSATDESNWQDPLFTSERFRGKTAIKEEAKSAVTGFVSIQGQEKHYALADGKWIKTEVVPSGFLVGHGNEEN